MWVRAVWMEGDREEGVIPENWVQEKTVWWPNILNVLKPLHERKEPLDSWYRFPLLKMKMRAGWFH